MGTTANGLPYPTDASSFDPPADLAALASALDRKINGKFTTTADRDLAYPSPSDAQVIYTDADDVLWLRRAGVWRKLFSESSWLPITPLSPWTVSTNGAERRVKNDYVDFTVHLTRNTSWTGPISLWQFDTGERPTRKPWYFHASRDLAAGGTSITNVTVATTGVATLAASGAANDTIAVSGRFPID